MVQRVKPPRPAQLAPFQKPETPQYDHSCLQEAYARPLTHYLRHSSYIGVIPNNRRTLIRHEDISDGFEMQGGQMRAIVAYPFMIYNHVYFFLLDGHHRADAAEKAGVKGVYAIVIGFFPTSHFRVKLWRGNGSVKKSEMFLRGWKGELYPFQTTRTETLCDDGEYHALHHLDAMTPRLGTVEKPGIPLEMLDHISPPPKFDLYVPPPVPMHVLRETPKHVAYA